MTHHFTLLGSQSAPPDALDLVRKTTRRLVAGGLELRTGPMPGVDRAAIETARSMFIESRPGWAYGPAVENDDAIDRWALKGGYSTSGAYGRLRPLVDGFGDLSVYAKHWWCATLAQLTGLNLDAPSRMLIVWTPDAATKPEHITSATGHAARAILMASQLNIPVFNLANPEHARRLTGEKR